MSDLIDFKERLQICEFKQRSKPVKNLFLILILVVLSAGVAQATPTKYTAVTKDTWTAPVEYTDGSPLPVEEINGYWIYCAKEPGAYSNASRHFVASGATEMVLLGAVSCLTEGDNYMTITTEATNGTESEYSSEGYVKKIGSVFYLEAAAGKAPKPVTGFAVQ